MIAEILDRHVEDLFDTEKPYWNSGLSHADRITFCHSEIKNVENLINQATDDDGNSS